MVDEQSGFQEDVEQFIDIHKELQELSMKTKALKASQSAISERLLEQFALLGMTSANVNGLTLYRRIDRHVTIPRDKQHEAVQLAEAEGMDDMVVLQPARYKSWVLEHIDGEDGEDGELPANWAALTTIHESPSLRVRNA